jgi:pyrroline-5-carboxylate reductase
MDVGLLGSGHIARALAQGWSRPQMAAGQRPRLHFYDLVGERAADLARECGGQQVGSVPELLAAARIVVLAVRPPDVAAALADVGSHLEGKLLVSLAAGVPVAALARSLPAGAQVGRIMPNLAVAAGRGLLLLAAGTLADSVCEVAGVFGLVGEVVTIDEALFDAATALSGCGPGFAALFLAALETGGCAAGLDAATAHRLAVGALAGAAALGDLEPDPKAIVRAVCSPGGMTAAGIAVLEDGHVPQSVVAAVLAAVEQAGRLA